MKTLITTGFTAALLAVAGTALVSCSGAGDGRGTEYAPDMYTSPAVEPLRQTEANAFNFREGGTNLRYPVAGTIARGKMAYYTHFSKDSLAEAAAALKNPLPMTEQNLAEGKVLYMRFCQPCHGDTGKGDGLVGQKYKGVANFQAGNVKGASQGHIFHVITHGKGRMYPHGSQVNPEERWKIALFVATLQNPDAAAAMMAAPAAESAGTNTSTADPAGNNTLNTNPVTGTTTDPTKDTEN